MRKLYAIAATVCMSLCASAAAPQFAIDKSRMMVLPQAVPMAELADIDAAYAGGEKAATLKQIPASPAKADAAEVTDWGEWTAQTTFKVNEAVYTNLRITNTLGDDAPTYKESGIQMYKRVSASNPNVQQLKFEDFIAGQDLIVDYDASTGIAKSNGLIDLGYAVSDGIKSSIDNPFDNYHLNVGSGRYYETTQLLRFGFAFFLANATMGYNFGFVLDGENAEPLKFKIDYPTSVTDDVTEIEVKITECSSFVKKVRVFKHYDGLDMNEMFKPTPAEGVKYQDLDVAQPFKVDVSDALNDYSRNRYLLLDAANKPVNGYYIITVFRYEDQDKYTWNDLGTGKMRELINYSCMLYEEREKYFVYDAEGNWEGMKADPVETQVKIQERADKPGMFRIVEPFTASHPNWSKLIVADDGIKHYILIDATDPSRVVVPPCLIGLNAENMGLAPMRSTNLWVGVPEDRLYGKLYDRHLIFKWGALCFDGQVVGGMYGIDMLNPLEVWLPDFVDYEIEMEPDTPVTGRKVNAPATVKTLDCALISNDIVTENEHYPENLWKMIADKTDGVKVVSVDVVDGSATIDIQKMLDDLTGAQKAPARVIPMDPERRYGLVIVPRDAQGAAHAGIDGGSYRYSPMDSWKSFGVVQVDDQMSLCMFSSMKQLTYTAEFLQAPDVEVYCLHRLFQHYCMNNNFAYNNTYLNDMFIDARDHNKVKLIAGPGLEEFEGKEGFEVGLETGYGSSYLVNASQWVGSDDEQYYGKLVDGTVTFDRASLVSTLPGYNTDIYWLGDKFEFKLPEGAGVQDIVADDDADATPVYYNLQGVRVSEPTPGLYIVKRGAKASKVLVK